MADATRRAKDLGIGTAFRRIKPTSHAARIISAGAMPARRPLAPAHGPAKLPCPPAPMVRAGLIAGVLAACLGYGSLAPAAAAANPVSRSYPTVASGCACADRPAAVRRFEHVIVIVLENTDFNTAMDNPYLRALANEGANLVNFHGLFHPSYPNYLAMVAGKATSARSDEPIDLNECTIGDTLTNQGLSWKNYAQGYPEGGRCFLEDETGNYARWHVPFINFLPARKNRCANVVPARAFAADLAAGRLPNYAFYTPDMENDGHDTDVDWAARWLKSFLEPLRSGGSWPKDTLIVVTFDESEEASARSGNRIYTVLLGNMVKPVSVKARYDHYSLLRTIEDNFGLCPLGQGDGAAEPIAGVWKE